MGGTKAAPFYRYQRDLRTCAVGHGSSRCRCFSDVENSFPSTLSSTTHFFRTFRFSTTNSPGDYSSAACAIPWHHVLL